MSAEHSTHHAKRPHSPPSPDDENDGQEVPRRQRSREACAPCRHRKRKCNGRLPCDTCVRYEYKCEYTTPGRPSISQAELGSQDDPSSDSTSTNHQNTIINMKNSIIKLQAHPLTAPGARFHHRGMLDPLKTRFVRANSAIAFPRILGMEFESDSIPRLHSFAWNLGVRPESVEELTELPALLSWNEMQKLAGLYFQIVRPEIGLLDQSDFIEQANNRFNNPGGYSDFDAVVLGVAALGSFFSNPAHPREAEFLVEARRSLVQFSLNRSPTSNHVAGWILRTIYLRLTSRPHASWITSCIALHQVEACGLHKEMQTIAVVYPAAPQGDGKLAKSRRRMFWIARALNSILSFEFGRSRVNFEVVTTRKFAAEPGSSAHQFVELAELLPNDFVDRDREPDPPAALSAALTKLEDLCSPSSSVNHVSHNNDSSNHNTSHGSHATNNDNDTTKTNTSTTIAGGSPFIRLLKADLAFGIYRRLWLMSLTDAKDRTESVIKLGRSALAAARTLLDGGTAWWNVVGTPFQFVCVLLAIGTPKALEIVPEALELLRGVARRWDTHMVREAVAQATALVGMARRRKERELGLLMTSLGGAGVAGDVVGDDAGGAAISGGATATGDASVSAGTEGGSVQQQQQQQYQRPQQQTQQRRQQQQQAGLNTSTFPAAGMFDPNTSSPAWAAGQLSVGSGSTPAGMSDAPAAMDWAEDLPFAWDMFLNPDLVISQQQGYLQGMAAAGGAGFGMGTAGMPGGVGLNSPGTGMGGGGQSQQQQQQQQQQMQRQQMQQQMQQQGFGNGASF